MSLLFWGTILLHGGLIVSNVVILIPYTTLYKKNTINTVSKHSKTISILSVNVYQFNQRYDELVKLVQEVKPDTLLTIESNQAWEDAMAQAIKTLDPKEKEEVEEMIKDGVDEESDRPEVSTE